MSVSSKTIYLIECDDGRYCGPRRIKVEIEAFTKSEACNKAKGSGWHIQHYNVVQCSYCKQQRRPHHPKVDP